MADKAHFSHTMLAQSKCFINSPVYVFNVTDISFKSPNFLNFLYLHLLLSTIQPALIVNMMHKLYCSSIICMSWAKQPSMLFTAIILSSFPDVFFFITSAFSKVIKLLRHKGFYWEWRKLKMLLRRKDNKKKKIQGERWWLAFHFYFCRL